jgi:hypothetical protein
MAANESTNKIRSQTKTGRIHASRIHMNNDYCRDEWLDYDEWFSIDIANNR